MKVAGISWRAMGWSLAGLLLLLPWAATRLGADVAWTAYDYLLAAALLAGAGGAIELAVRLSPSLAYRLAAVLAGGVALLTFWINGAVGIIGAEDNPANAMFLAAPLAAFAGSLLSRFRPAGMALTMLAAASTQAIVALFAVGLDIRAFVLSAVFTLIWLAAGLLFRKSAGRSAEG